MNEQQHPQTRSEPAPTPLANDEQIAELRGAWRQETDPARSKALLSVMLVRRAGWTVTQTADFLGISETTITHALEGFKNGGVKGI
jgi:hypothetical protein